MTTMSPQEQLILEMINRARLDPLSEAQKYGVTLNQFVDLTQFSPITATPKQPLAGNNLLSTAAENHTVYLSQNPVLNTPGANVHAEPTPGFVTIGDRAHTAGYQFSSLRENVETNFFSTFNESTQTKLLHQGLFIDDPTTHTGSGGGHRVGILDDNMKEIGIGYVQGINGNNNAVAVTEDFGVIGTQSFLTGVVYNDIAKAGDPNKEGNTTWFYDLGEAKQGVVVTVAGVGSNSTGSGGGWSVGMPGGTFNVTFSGGGLPAAVSATIEAGSLNAKVDLVNNTEIFSSANATLGAGATALHLLGIVNINGTGNSGDNFLYGTKGNNVLDGGLGTDTAVYSGSRASYTVSLVNGNVLVTGAEGTDTLKSVEKIKFADQTIDAPGQAPVPVAGSVSIDDRSVAEGDNGTKIMTFTVTRKDGQAAFNVNFATTDGAGATGATVADKDYVANANVLPFAFNEMSKSISIVINGDNKVEGHEFFNVLLSNATNGATISDGLGVGTITNDDVAGSVRINDVSVVEGDNGTSFATFTVTRSDGAAAFNVNYATSNGSAAIADKDYAATSSILTFNVGDVSKQFTVAINGDTKVEGTETFNVNLSNATNGAVIADGLGVGTILNDDHAAHDFGGEGRSDLLWHNKNGSVAMWQMNGNQITANQTVGSTGAGWDVVNTGDFGGDGRSDLLLRNDSTGGVAMWQMNGSQITANNTFATMSSAFHVAGVDDFNGDGRSDILWHNSANGSVVMWQMNGTQIVANQTVGSTAAGWEIAGTGDFNGDGRADILLWNDAAGKVAMWQMNGSQITLNSSFATMPTAFEVAGVADFNGDGRSDILWHNEVNGTVVMWQMNGTQITSNQTVGSAALPWDIVDTGDFNNDGRGDIVWQNGSSVAMWEMDGTQTILNTGVGTIGTDWHLV